MSWYYNATNVKSLGELDRLVNEVILAEDFSQHDLTGFRAARELKQMDTYQAENHSGALGEDISYGEDCRQESVFIPLPCDGVPQISEKEAPKFEVTGLHRRSLVVVLKSALSEQAATKFHLFPRVNRTPVCIGLMIWSDSTHLASFGTATLWPIYLYIRNQSKYIRAKPSEFAAHHLAYIHKLMQAVWLLLLDNEFMHAYLHGIEIDFDEDNQCLFFPRFLTDSADYPEKVLLACIKYLAQCPCPRCLVLKSKIPRLGTKPDMKDRLKLTRVDNVHIHLDIETVRKWLFEKGINVSSKHVMDILGAKSLTPTCLGVWRSIFTHLLRILHAHRNDSINILNSRYRSIPTFGHSTIRKFHNNASSMKKLAARDFEDLLLCAIPVFEGLLPPVYDRIVRNLLFELATWHALAKLCLHTETTLNDLENSTTRLGEAVRIFEKDVCAHYVTKELPSEEAARGRREARKRAANNAPTTISSNLPKSTAKKPKKLNTKVYNYNSQTGELEHRRGKQFYPRVRKGFHASGIAKETRRERLLHNIKQRRASIGCNSAQTNVKSTGRRGRREKLAPTSPTAQHQISRETAHKISIADLLDENEGDPALKDFMHRLQENLLACFLSLDNLEEGTVGPEFTDEQRATIIIEDDLQDVINPRTHPDLLLLSSEEHSQSEQHPHLYWYARVLRIFHARVCHVGSLSQNWQPQHMEFLFVRWFAHCLKPVGGWNTRRLHRVAFFAADAQPFGFVDPAHILRAAHLIPAFAWQETNEYLNSNKDYCFHYVSMFVDRDMVMRFRGGGVGHKSTQLATNFFEQDHHKLDKERHCLRGQETEMEIDEEEHPDQEVEDLPGEDQDNVAVEGIEDEDEGSQGACSNRKEDAEESSDKDSMSIEENSDGGEIDEADELGFANP
ncbi:hypothetical protein CPB83DRAFT_872126 [Crepidotus variabilis]|uniref:Uncharacterized protein n=1 Tax=Crepidotus variabilis TaxID=179855 RepID=A0A9P6E3S2_9AGAR|nr:hypothetical protein CPB83DRAFT_872126 [Crepidotus variabilis]